MPPIVYGELSILGYNGYIPNAERSGRRSKSKFLLCQRTTPNGIKKSRHYIVKQPQATKAIQDKDLHSISYTFSRSQTIIVEYKQDEMTDMFQIGRSSEEPIDFVVMDTLPNTDCNSSNNGSNLNNRQHHLLSSAHSSSHRQHNHHHHQRNHHNHSENASSSQQIVANDLISRFHRHLAKVGEEMLQYGISPPNIQDPRGHRLHYGAHQQAQAAVLLNYPQPNISNMPPMLANHFRNQDSSIFQHSHAHQRDHYNITSSGSQQQQQQQLLSSSSARSNNNHIPSSNNNNNQSDNCSNCHNNIMYKRSHGATQSTISRFACRILVDREPPYTARIYAAGFDSSKNIFLGEKATKWEQNNSIDGLTTNGVLLMHPQRGHFYVDSGDSTQDKQRSTSQNDKTETMIIDDSNSNTGDNDDTDSDRKFCSNREPIKNSNINNEHLLDGQVSSSAVEQNYDINNDLSEQSRFSSSNTRNNNSDNIKASDPTNPLDGNDSNNNLNNEDKHEFKYDGIWREVSVDGGIYAIRESRSAIQKGTRIETETNILQDGTLIDLCGATLLWRSLDGFKASPTKKSLEEKIDLLNASRPQCPVGLNTLVIPRKPILPNNHRSGGHNHHQQHRHQHQHGSKDHHNEYSSSSSGGGGKDSDKNSHQPYVYLKCGHVQGYHDWGTTDKSNQRTCPICLSVGTVAKLSMGLEPSFYVDSGPLTHVFNPCGHMASEKTVKYWCSVKIPHGTHFFHAICPFCATPLAINESPSTKLIFQDDLD